MSRIPQDPALMQHLLALLEAHRGIFRQTRVFQRVVALVMAELMTFARHTITQLILSLGLADRDWSGWYRLFSQGRFDAEAASRVLLAESLRHVGPEELYVVVGDGTQTPRSSRKMEGVHWLHAPRTPVFKRGIHLAQRWFHGGWLMPAQEGYSRVMPLRWMPAFTEKSKPHTVAPCKEWEAAERFLRWLISQLAALGRAGQRVLMVGDGRYDNRNLWLQLPEGVILLVRTAKNRALWELPEPGSHKNRRYGERAPTPQAVWRERKGWQAITLRVRGRDRHLQVKVRGPFLRRGVPARPLMLIVVRGKDNRRTRREPLAFLVNAVQDEAGRWGLPLPLEELLFWAWQRWEVEVAHRELKTTFGLGHKQAWNPEATVRTVQWSAWVYALLVLAGYRAWGLTGGPGVPTAWWRGGGRWSLATLWRAYRATLWGGHQFQWVNLDDLLTRPDLGWMAPSLRNAAFAGVRT